tara:strand:+ start:3108 stop:5234 length:2127 start_codon:yes stop_codon:yes gene_type:complete
MYTIQLFIKDNDGSDVRVDLFKDESVTITQTIQNIRDIGAIFTDFTRTFNIPASPNTNRLFKHYYNSDIVSSSNNLISDFDARSRKDARIELNHTPFKKGQIRLDGVLMKDNKPNSYKITFFGNTVKLSTVLRDLKLDALDLSVLDTTYTEANLKTKLQSAISDLIVPIITHTRRLVYNSGDTTGQPIYSGIIDNIAVHSPVRVDANRGLRVKDLKYAIRVHKIIEAIEARFSEIKFSTDFLNTTNQPYYNLFMWLHRKEGDVGTDAQVGEPFVQSLNTFATGTFVPANSPDQVSSSIVSDGTTLTVSGTDNLNFNISVTPSDNSINYSLSVSIDGEQKFNTQGTGVLSIDMISLGVNPIQTGDYTFSISSTSSATVTFTYSVTMTTQGVSDPQIVDEQTYSVSSSSSISFTQAQAFIISKELPDIKIIDFLTGIFKMFNLTAFVEDDGTIKIQTLDSFYASGVSRNITDFVDINQSEINNSLPFREIDFRYQGRQSFFADTHEKIFNLEWGTETINFSDVTQDGSVYKIELPFEHHKFQRLLDLNDTTGDTSTDVQFGWSVNIDQSPFIGKPVLFYPVRKTSGTAIQLKDSSNNTLGAISTYILPSNTLTLATDSQSIHFSTELSEYTNETVLNNLFSEYYKTYISDVFDSKNRLTRVTAYLPAKILLNLSLADRLEINQKSYKINSITTDMENGKSELELINNFNA